MAVIPGTAVSYTHRPKGPDQPAPKPVEAVPDVSGPSPVTVGTMTSYDTDPTLIEEQPGRAPKASKGKAPKAKADDVEA